MTRRRTPVQMYTSCRHSAVAAWLSLMLAACATGDTDSPDPEGTIDRQCSDGRDNDGDGQVDCADSDCASNAACVVIDQDASADVGDTSDAGTDAPDLGDTDTDAEPDSDIDIDDDAGDDADSGDTTDAADAPDAAETTDATDVDDATDAADDAADVGDADAVDADVSDPDTDVGGDPYPVRSCSVDIDYDPPGNPLSVNVGAEWTGFDPAALPMTGPDTDGVFSLSVPGLDPGEYGFKFIVDGVWEDTVPPDVMTRWNGGTENRALVVPDCGLPTLEPTSASSSATGVSASFQFVAASDGAALDPDAVRVTVGGVDHAAEIDVVTGVITVDADGLAAGKHSVRVWATDVDGREIDNAPVFIPLWVEATPFTWQDATMYFVFTDRFRNGDWDAADPIAEPIPEVPEIANYQGGDFLGVIQAIEEGYFEAMGVNLLWLSPVYENPEGAYLAADRFHNFSGFHGYWPTHSRQIEFRWGDVDGDAAERLHELIDAAHARGIRVMFDLVLNHVHEDHHYTREHTDWFGAAPCPCTTDPGPCNWDTNPLFCWFIDYLPDLDYTNHEIAMQIVDDVEWFVTEFDVDGFRLDAAKHMHHIAMRRVAMRLQERFNSVGGAPFYLVGETFTSQEGHGQIMDYVAPYELDGQFDFPLMWPIRAVWVGNNGFDLLADRVRIGHEQYGDALWWMSPFLGNHDIPRMATEISSGGVDPWAGTPDPMADGLNGQTWNVVNRMSQAFAFVLTQPGVPLIYYGDEIGLHGGGDPDNRRMMHFDPNLSDAQSLLLERVQAIGQARQDHYALRHGAYRELWRDSNAYVYARDAGAGNVVIVAMFKNTNGAESARTWSVPIPDDLSLNGATLVDVLNPDDPRQIRVADGNAAFTLNDWEYVILARP